MLCEPYSLEPMNNAVEIISWDNNVLWFTWAFGTNLGYFSVKTNVELDVDGRPTLSFRQAIVNAVKRFEATNGYA